MSPAVGGDVRGRGDDGASTALDGVAGRKRASHGRATARFGRACRSERGSGRGTPGDRRPAPIAREARARPGGGGGARRLVVEPHRSCARGDEAGRAPAPRPQGRRAEGEKRSLVHPRQPVVQAPAGRPRTRAARGHRRGPPLGRGGPAGGRPAGRVRRLRATCWSGCSTPRRERPLRRSQPWAPRPSASAARPGTSSPRPTGRRARRAPRPAAGHRSPPHASSSRAVPARGRRAGPPRLRAPPACPRARAGRGHVEVVRPTRGLVRGCSGECRGSARHPRGARGPLRRAARPGERPYAT
jgi:hypothetical protein